LQIIASAGEADSAIYLLALISAHICILLLLLLL
jgi:hypothetical protein